MWAIRPLEPRDGDAVLALADRLSVGSPSWRDRGRWLIAVRGWVEGSARVASEPGHAMFVACEDGRVAGFVSLGTRTHFTGDVDAYIGELVVAEWAEGRGAGRALLSAAEQWATAEGHRRLTLESGAANARALQFYTRAGYREEDIRLTKLMTPS